MEEPAASEQASAGQTTPGQGEDLVARVLSGEHPRLEELAARGVLPLPREELLRLQVRLASSGRAEVAETARATIKEHSIPFLLDFIRHEAGKVEVGFFLRSSTDPSLTEAAIQHRALDAELLGEVAPRLDERGQEVLLLRQDLIRESPEVLEALSSNPKLTSYSRRLIGEYKRHLLVSDEQPAIPAPEPEPTEPHPLDPEGEWTSEEAQEVDEAIADVLESVEAEGEFDERTGLTEGQVRMLPLPVRAKLARGAGRALRGILIRDANPQVAVAVLKGSAFSEAEAEIVSANRYVATEVLQEIGLRRDWIMKYQIMSNLVKNPRTPIAMAIKLIPRLSIRDLGQLRRDRNVPDAVRQMAARLHVARMK